MAADNFNNKYVDVADYLFERRDYILEEWKCQPGLQTVLQKKGIIPDFFMKHFGTRIMDYFIGILRHEYPADGCPVVMVMLKFFAYRKLSLEEIYYICAGQRNVIMEELLKHDFYKSQELFRGTIDFFDANFASVIHEYVNMVIPTSGQDTKKISNHATVIFEHEAENTAINHTLIDEYFAADDEEYGVEKVLFQTDDADELIENFSEISEHISLAYMNSDYEEINLVAELLSKTSSILLHYTPYLDTLAESFSELAGMIIMHKEAFMNALKGSDGMMIKLFDAVNADMDRYIQRFTVENIAMKNTHHIHDPTTLSIRQIITLFMPDEVEAGEIEFF